MKTLRHTIDAMNRDIKRARETLQTTKDYAAQIRCRSLIKKFSTVVIKLKKAVREIECQLGRIGQ